MHVFCLQIITSSSSLIYGLNVHFSVNLLKLSSVSVNIILSPSSLIGHSVDLPLIVSVNVIGLYPAAPSPVISPHAFVIDFLLS